ncbi:hypothetical protein DYB35_007218 [Aphanomyces astaci]|uniref:DEAD-box helicase OB fold domain-containing protein n=1 Tax=Aphanomyces astaci TaxID=112090 RepID=A0A3R6ZSI8_APHAT|nr:hypothetical protein DYB35_007218 [Aphanomyces astaci]
MQAQQLDTGDVHASIVLDTEGSPTLILTAMFVFVLLWLGSCVGLFFWKRHLASLRSDDEDDEGATSTNLAPLLPPTRPLIDTTASSFKLSGTPTYKRIKSLDTFRGMTIFLMIFVNYGGGGMTPAQKQERKQAKRMLGQTVSSDHLVVHAALQGYIKRPNGAARFCQQNWLVASTLSHIHGVVKQVANEFAALGYGLPATLSVNPQLAPMAEAVLAAGLYPNLMYRSKGTANFTTKEKFKVKLSSSTVLVYSPKVLVVIDNWIVLSMDGQEAEMVLALRQRFHEAFLRHLHHDQSAADHDLHLVTAVMHWIRGESATDS